MNRRGFLKALAATSLLGLLTKMPKAGDRDNLRFEDWEAEQMWDPEFRAVAEELEPAYQDSRLQLIAHQLLEQSSDIPENLVLIVLSPNESHGWQEMLIDRSLLDSDSGGISIADLDIEL